MTAVYCDTLLVYYCNIMIILHYCCQPFSGSGYHSWNISYALPLATSPRWNCFHSLTANRPSAKRILFWDGRSFTMECAL